jgi:hypothetical protein
MYWKLSIDLSRPLVASMGQHDALDGFVTCTQLEASASSAAPSLRDATADFRTMINPRGLTTHDPLSLGGLLTDACRLTQLARRDREMGSLVDAALGAALGGLRHFAAQAHLAAPAHHRLAFRELGLAIGLAGLQSGIWREATNAVRARIEDLAPYVSLRSEIEEFWLEPEHRRVDTWLEHENINDVMLATSLEPDGFLTLRASS